MQNRKNKKRNTGNYRRPVRFEELLDDERFDDEDYDTVTEDTLEFLSLDDDMIESYQRTHSSKGRKYSSAAKFRHSRYDDDDDEDYESEDYDDDDEDYESEDYEDDEDYESGDYEDDEDYESGDYEDDEDYESEDYEDDEDYEPKDYEDDEDYESGDYDDDEEDYDGDYDYDDDDGIAARLMYFIGEMSGLDVAVALLGILVLAGAIVTGAIYARAKSMEKQVAAFAAVGEEIEGIAVIGESGFLAAAESARLGSMIDVEEENPDEEEPEETEQKDEKGEVEVQLHLTSILSDMKIKFVNKGTGKLIGGVPFEVEIAGPKSQNLKDDDKDGVIYQTGIAAGTYDVKILPLSGDAAEKYKLPSKSSSVKVTDKIAYQKVDVADEVKTEAEINVAKEEAPQQNTVVESALQDTVEWVESTKTPIGEETADYEKVPSDKIVDPWKTSSAFRKMVEDGGNDPYENVKVSMNKDSLSLDKGGSDSLKVSVSNDVDYSVEWSVADSSIATVDGGKVTAVAPGSTTVTARVMVGSMIQEFNCSVVVKGTDDQGSGDNKDQEGGDKDQNNDKDKEPVKDKDKDENKDKDKDKEETVYKKIVISGKNEVAVGKKITLAAKTDPEGGKVTWSSDDEKTAKVDEKGEVTGIAEGEVKIRALCNNPEGKEDIKESVKIKVVKESVSAEEIVYKKISISGKDKVAVGEKVTFTAKTDPEGGKVTWSSDDEKIAKVNEKGEVTGITEGEVKIHALMKNPEGKEDVRESVKIKVVKETISVDETTKLKDKDGNQLYYKNSEGEYKEATYKDYKERDTFYKKIKTSSAYKYTGWQTIDGHLYYYDKDGNYVTGDQVIQGARYSFGSDGKLAKSSGTMGIDVSKHNGNIDWNAVKNSGVSYVIIRCGYRGYTTGVLVEDPKFRSNIKGAKAAGLKVGAYFYSQAVNEVEAVEEASMAIDLVKGYGLNYPLFLDVEASGGRADSIGRDTRTAVCRTFCQTVQNSGISAGIYANKTWFTEKINTASLTNYKLWLAQYASAPTYTATRYDLWQYSSKGRVSGISTNVDMNISYVAY